MDGECVGFVCVLCSDSIRGWKRQVFNSKFDCWRDVLAGRLVVKSSVGKNGGKEEQKWVI